MRGGELVFLESLGSER